MKINLSKTSETPVIATFPKKQGIVYTLKYVLSQFINCHHLAFIIVKNHIC